MIAQGAGSVPAPDREAAGPWARTVHSYFVASLHDYTSGWHVDHMHYGYCRTLRQLVDFDGMLNEMCRQVSDRLMLVDAERDYRILDIGCGVMGTSRFVARDLPRAHFYCLNIVPEYLRYGAVRNVAVGYAERIHPIVADFDGPMPLRAGWFDGAYAIEALVHAANRNETIREIGTAIRREGTFVIADGFRTREFGALTKVVHRKWSEAFAASLAPLEETTQALERAGFEAKVERIDWRVAPTVAHLPSKMLQYLRTKRRDLNWRNMVGVLTGAVLGTTRACGYYLITAKRRG